MANLVHNEQVKLFATLLNTVAAGSATVGVLAPISAIIFQWRKCYRLSKRGGLCDVLVDALPDPTWIDAAGA